MARILSTSVPSVRRGTVGASVDAELVLLGERDGRYHGLDQVGAEVWEALDGERTVAEICDALVASYDVDPATCEADVIAFLDALATRNLIDVR